MLERLRADEDFRSELARQVGWKGYHGPGSAASRYPVDDEEKAAMTPWARGEVIALRYVRTAASSSAGRATPNAIGPEAYGDDSRSKPWRLPVK